MARNQYWDRRSLDQQRTMDEMISHHDAQPNHRKRYIFLATMAILLIAISIPFISTLWTHRVGLVSQSGRADFTVGQFAADNISNLHFDMHNATLQFQAHDENTISFQTSGARIVLHYVFDVDGGSLHISRAGGTRDAEGDSVVMVLMPRGVISDVTINLRGTGNNNDINITGVNFYNLAINTFNGSVAMSNADIEGDFFLRGRHGVRLENVGFDEGGADIASPLGEVVVY